MEKKFNINFEGKNYDCKIESNDDQNICIIFENEGTPKYKGNISLQDIYKKFSSLKDYTMKDFFAILEDLKDEKFQIKKEEDKYQLNILIKVLKKEKPLIIDIVETTYSKNDLIQFLIKKVKSNAERIACLEKELKNLKIKKEDNKIIKYLELNWYEKLNLPSDIKPADIFGNKKEKQQDILLDVLNKVLCPPESIKNNPDTDDLIKEGETKDILTKIPAIDFLKKWVNKHLKASRKSKRIKKI